MTPPPSSLSPNDRGSELSHARLSELLRHAPAFIAVLRGPEHRVEHVNEQFLHFIGYRETEGLPTAEALPELIPQGLVGLLDQVYRSGKPHVGREVRIMLHSGSDAAPAERIIDFVYQPLVERQGAVTGILVHGVDLTQSKRTEAELQSTRERVQLATQAADLGVWRWEIAEDRSHCENDRASEIFGLPHGTTPLAAGGFIADLCHPEDAVELKTQLALALSRQGDFQFVGRIRRQRDRAIRWVEMIGRFQPASGALPACLVGTVADITQRQQAQAQMLASERKYRSLVESMDEGFCVIQLIFDAVGRAQDYRFIETNPAFVEQTGLVHAEGRLALDLVPTLEREWLDTYGQVARSGRPLRFVQHSPAMGRWFNIYAAPTGDVGSLQVAVLFTDVTEQKTAEMQLKRLATELSEADQRKDRFLATLAHELRNPLAPLRNGLALIRSAAANEPLLNVAREMMDRQLTQLTSLVSDLLDVARSHSGKLELKRELVLLEPMVRTAVETSLPHIEAAGHVFKLRLPKSPVWLDADPTRVAQILNNLLDNAAKYTPPQGRIELAAECQGAELVLSVSDNGAGLTSEMIDSVFEMFSQGSDAKLQSPGGLGIGLSLVRDLARLHGGSVAAHSDGLGRGSVFTVRLPLPAAVSDDAAATPDLRSAPAAAKARRWRVLVADDNRDAGESLALLLQLNGHVTVWARDGLDALSMVQSFEPELVILDIGMPGLDGYEVARRLRQDPQTAGLVLVALTGWGADEDRARSSGAGFDLHLTKPADPGALLELMQTMTSRAARHDG
jgi:signal transduction histidine kinase/CheY-like chemotaxis protein